MRKPTPATIAFTVLLLTSCTRSSFQIGVVLPLTGRWATIGASVNKGIAVGFEELQASGGELDLHLVIRDGESDADTAQQRLRELYDEGVWAAIGGVTAEETRRMIDAADDHGRLLLSAAASSPRLSGSSANFYRVFPSDAGEGNRMAHFATQVLGLANVVIVAEREGTTDGIEQVFGRELRRLGGEVLEEIELSPGASDLSPVIDRVGALRPQAVYLTAHPATAVTVVRQLRRAGYAGKILTTHGVSRLSDLAPLGELAQGLLFTQYPFDVDSDHAHVRRFVAAYRQRFNENPDLYAAHGYDAIRALVSAIESQPQAVPSDMIKGMRGVRELPGVTGSIQFNDDGDVTRFSRVYIVDPDLEIVQYDAYLEKLRQELGELEDEIRRGGGRP